MQTNGNGSEPEFLDFDWFKRALGGAPEVTVHKPAAGAYSDLGIESVRLVQQHVLTTLSLKSLSTLKSVIGNDFTGAGRKIEGMIQEIQLLRHAIAQKYGEALLDKLYQGHDPLQES